MDSGAQFLEIVDWQKYEVKLKSGRPRRDWIKLPTSLEDDPEWLDLTDLEKMVLVGIWRLRARTGANLKNDPRYISTALQVNQRSRARMTQVLTSLIHHRFLVLCNQQKSEESATNRETIAVQKLKKHKPTNGNGNGHFVPPTVEEIEAYMREKQFRDPAGRAEEFWNHYEARGWKPKGYTQQMKSWKATVATWKKNEGRWSDEPEFRFNLE